MMLNGKESSVATKRLLPAAFLLAACASAAASPAGEVTLAAESELTRYWVFDAKASLPLLEASGTSTVVPPEIAREAGRWEKTFTVYIDSQGRVASAECSDCASGDRVAPFVRQALLLNRYQPAPGNADRTAVVVPMRVHSIVP